MMVSLRVNFQTFKVIAQLYLKEFRMHLGDKKVYKNRLQLLCANSDPMESDGHKSVEIPLLYSLRRV